MAQTNDVCNICVEKMNKTIRAPISCVKCDLVCCKSCFKRYITDPEHYLQCMSCRVEFDRLSLFERMGPTFMKVDFRDIRQAILYEKEKAFLPATQLLVERELEIEKLTQEKANLDKKYALIRKERMIPLKDFRTNTDMARVCDVLDTYLSLQANIEIVDEQLQDERKSITEKINTLESKPDKVKTRTYVLACTKGNCKGMLSNESKNQFGHYVCTICEGITCCECKMELSQADHECDPEILKSVKFVESNSKPCPGCGAQIHKISGCNAMFCTSCHASFDWKTLKLTNGNVHNPHQAEWLRLNQNRPREIGDIQCGRELTINIAIAISDRFTLAIKHAEESNIQFDRTAKKKSAFLFEAVRVGIHHTHVTLPNLSRNRYGHHTNQKLRMGLLRGFVEEEKFKAEIQRMDKATSRRQDLLHVVMTYRDSLTDIIWEFVATRKRKSVEEWIKMVQQVEKLIEYVDQCFIRIAQVFGSYSPHRIMSDRSIN